MNNLDNLTAVRPKDEYARLLGLELAVPTDEQLEKARATSRARGNSNPPAPRASLRITWEPLSYEMRGHNGNVVTDYIDVSFGLEPDDLARIRTNGWLGIPDRKLIRVDEKTTAAGQTREWPRYRLQTRDILHIDIDVDGSVTGKVGQPFSKDIGRVFHITEGYDSFPRNVQNPATKMWSVDKDNPRSSFMRYPVEAADDYVAPAEVPVRIPRNASTEAGAVETTTNVNTLTTNSLRAAVEASGMIGMEASKLTGAMRQISFLASHMEDDDTTLVFGTGELNEAANGGELLTYLETKGALSIADGVIA